jgi:hypothetical protein
MLNATQIVARALNAGVCLNHHVGVSAEAKTRARGSSAWRASLDAQVLITKKDGLMEITCTKMKDTEEPQPFFGKLEPVPLGWVDEDGEEIKGAVFALENAPDVAQNTVKKDSKIDTHRKTWENAWAVSGMDELDGFPYLTRSALRDKLQADGNAERTVRNMLNPSYSDKLIGILLNAEIIETKQNGWIMRDEIHASALLMRKSACG